MLAVHLNVDALVSRIGNSNATTRQKRNAAHASQSAGDHAQHVFQIGQGMPAAEEDDLEVFLEQARAGGDFEISAVVSDPADKCERAHRACSAVDLYFEFGESADCLSKAANPVSALAQARFQTRAEMVNNVRVKAYAGHG